MVSIFKTLLFIYLNHSANFQNLFSESINDHVFLFILNFFRTVESLRDDSTPLAEDEKAFPELPNDYSNNESSQTPVITDKYM